MQVLGNPKRPENLFDTQTRLVNASVRFLSSKPQTPKPILEAYLDFNTHNHKTHLDSEIRTREVSFLAWEPRFLGPNSRRNRASVRSDAGEGRRQLKRFQKL